MAPPTPTTRAWPCHPASGTGCRPPRATRRCPPPPAAPACAPRCRPARTTTPRRRPSCAWIRSRPSPSRCCRRRRARAAAAAAAAAARATSTTRRRTTRPRPSRMPSTRWRSSCRWRPTSCSSSPRSTPSSAPGRRRCWPAWQTARWTSPLRRCWAWRRGRWPRRTPTSRSARRGWRRWASSRAPSSWASPPSRCSPPRPRSCGTALRRTSSPTSSSAPSCTSSWAPPPRSRSLCTSTACCWRAPPPPWAPWRRTTGTTCWPI
mmetsp:Transcript_27447/g.69156  ORF Transcript_27447/g.69156 Transcript_27447/m.69156 type:complete len:263 (-) Transcript_27447:664-1452(-)